MHMAKDCPLQAIRRVAGSGDTALDNNDKSACLHGSWASLVAEVAKNLPAVHKTQLQSLSHFEGPYFLMEMTNNKLYK